MAQGAPRAARGRKGADAARRRVRAAAPSASLGRESTRTINSRPMKAAPRSWISSRGARRLLVYHFMFGPDYKAGCPSCSSIADGFEGFAIHLANHDVTLSAVSRAPFAKLQAYKRRMGWSFPLVSSVGSDFNFDFNVSYTEEQQRKGEIEYNFERGGHAMDATPVPEPVAQFAATCGTDASTFSRDRPGMSSFRARGRRRLPYLLHLLARARSPLGHVSMARPRAQGPQRERYLAAPPRRVPKG